MKKCNTCNIEKPLDGFFKHKRMKDGYTNICKDCRKSEFDEKMKDPNFVEKERARGRDKHQRLYVGVKLDKEVQKKSLQNWRLNFPEKAKAHILCKRLERPNGHEMHHWSYDLKYAMDVIPLDRKIHVFLHRHIIYDQEFMMYRNANTGELLDTKEKHINFINSLHYE